MLLLWSTGDNFTASGTLGGTGVHLCYYQKATEHLQLGVELETSLRMQESVASMAYQLEIPKANTVFRGTSESERNSAFTCNLLNIQLSSPQWLPTIYLFVPVLARVSQGKIESSAGLCVCVCVGFLDWLRIDVTAGVVLMTVVEECPRSYWWLIGRHQIISDHDK